MLYNARKYLLVQIVYTLFFLIPVYLFFGSNPAALFDRYRVGQAAGVLGITALTLQLALTSRMRFIERGVGMDRLTRFHKYNGIALLLALMMHPTLMFWDKLTSPGLWWETISTYTIYHWLGVAALTLIVVQIATTLYGHLVKLNYEHWKLIHKIGYVIILLGFVHSAFLGSDIVGPGPIHWWWVFLAAVATFAFSYRNIYRPYRWRNSWYTVEKIAKESADVRTITLKPEAKAISYAPGQFAFVRFKSAQVPWEEHHFTLSSTPGDPYLSFTVKESGDFTELLGGLKVGDRARLEGPYGAFSNVGMPGPFVFLVGGIGITPIMSMLRTMDRENKKELTTLIYVCSTLSEVAFKTEIDGLAKKNKWFKVSYVLSKEKVQGCYEGHLSREILQKEVKDLKSPTYFVVGPPPMMNAAVALLKEQNVPKRKIFTERFALR